MNVHTRDGGRVDTRVRSFFNVYCTDTRVSFERPRIRSMTSCYDLKSNRRGHGTYAIANMSNSINAMCNHIEFMDVGTIFIKMMKWLHA